MDKNNSAFVLRRKRRNDLCRTGKSHVPGPGRALKKAVQKAIMVFTGRALGRKFFESTPRRRQIFERLSETRVVCVGFLNRFQGFGFEHRS